MASRNEGRDGSAVVLRLRDDRDGRGRRIRKCGNGNRIAAEREQWSDGVNTLCIRPGVVIVYDRNFVTNEALRKHGIRVIEIPSCELSRGRGGPHCMSMALEREDI